MPCGVMSNVQEVDCAVDNLRFCFIFSIVDRLLLATDSIGLQIVTNVGCNPCPNVACILPEKISTVFWVTVHEYLKS